MLYIEIQILPKDRADTIEINNYIVKHLNQMILASFLCECGVWSSVSNNAYRIVCQNLEKKLEKTTQQHLKRKWTDPLDKNVKFHSVKPISA